MKEKEENLDNELAELEAEINEEDSKKEKEMQNKPDLYPDNIEDKYHNIEKIVSLGVLEKEKLFCFKIINYKKKVKKEFYYWENKKKNINKKVKSITSLIENKTWTFKMYKEKIKEEEEEEDKLLLLVDKEPNLNEEQKEIIKERINERKNIIEENIDLYPNTSEDIYHNLGKIVSLGVLEKEKELCDKIINYKKDKNKEFESWETKKDNIDKKINSITSLVSEGTWNLDIYKKKIKEENDWEQNLLELAENDSSLNEIQKKIIKIRIKKRKKIIEEELNKNPEEDD